MQVVFQSNNIAVTSTIHANALLPIVPYSKIRLILLYNNQQVYTQDWTSNFVTLLNTFSPTHFGLTTWQNGIYTVKYRTYSESEKDEGSIFIDVDIKDQLIDANATSSILHYTLVANTSTCETDKMNDIYNCLLVELTKDNGPCNC